MGVLHIGQFTRDYARLVSFLSCIYLRDCEQQTRHIRGSAEGPSWVSCILVGSQETTHAWCRSSRVSIFVIVRKTRGTVLTTTCMPNRWLNASSLCSDWTDNCSIVTYWQSSCNRQLIDVARYQSTHEHLAAWKTLASGSKNEGE